MVTLQVMILGSAGAGKTSLTARFGDWLSKEEFKVVYVNLDPGCISLPYKPSFDVRKYFTIEKLMMEKNLGPNGAMIKASELMQENVKKFLNEIEKFKGDFMLIDTPGQSEIFVFRPAGPFIAREFSLKAPTVGVYLIDPFLAETPSSLASAFSLALASQLRLGIPLILVLNKADEIKNIELEKMISNYDYLKEKVIQENVGAIKDLAIQLIEALKNLAFAQRLIKVSAKTSEGMPQLFDLIHESLCECGDLT
ncbi:MAG: ATP/GTP-binding protein [Candidatus Bathyarchaeia archaeon]